MIGLKRSFMEYPDKETNFTLGYSDKKQKRRT